MDAEPFQCVIVQLVHLLKHHYNQYPKFVLLALSHLPLTIVLFMFLYMVLFILNILH